MARTHAHRNFKHTYREYGAALGDIKAGVASHLETQDAHSRVPWHEARTHYGSSKAERVLSTKMNRGDRQKAKRALRNGGDYDGPTKVTGRSQARWLSD